MAKSSVTDVSDIVSETLAKIYLGQNNFSKAIQTYEKLMLKYPEKSVYFAALIKEILLQEKIEKITLIGHSMGGYITMAFAEKYPELLTAFGLFHSTATADDDEKIATRKKAIEFIQQNGSQAFLKTIIPGLFMDAGASAGAIKQLIEKAVYNSPVSFAGTSDNFRFACAVTEFGMVLRDSEFKGDASLTEILQLASGAKGNDALGYRTEFIDLVKQYSGVASIK